MPGRTNVVVVGVDGSADSTAAVKWADNYAALTGARVRLVTSWSWPVSYGAPLGWDGYNPAEDALGIIEKARMELTIPGSRIDTICQEGVAGPVLVTASEGASLLVVGCRGHGAISGVLLGSVSNHCVHHASCPVVIVR